MDAPIRILFEDDDVLVIDKPPGRVVVPGRREGEVSLRREIERGRDEPLWVVHRLDRDTSGVLLLARNADAHRELNVAFERRLVRKRYFALTRGLPPEVRGTIDTPLHTARRGKMRPAGPDEPGAQECRTAYHTTRRWKTAMGDVARLDVQPHTGRQHQVRVHLRSVGAPLLVDPLYGSKAPIRESDLGLPGDRVLCDRLTLHALSVDFPHPSTGARTVVESRLADDLAALVAALDGIVR